MVFVINQNKGFKNNLTSLFHVVEEIIEHLKNM